MGSVLKTFSRAGLHLKLEKCKFHKEEVKYFRLVITRREVKMVPNKVGAGQDTPIPKSTFDVQLFIGFVDF